MSSSGTTKTRIQGWLARPSSDKWLVLLGVLLTASSIGTGLVADDFIHADILRHLPTIASGNGPLDLFRFADGNVQRGQALIDAGELPWSANPAVHFSFFRPLSALTHVLDYALWPRSPWLMHVHSLVWFALALVGVAAVYRRFLGTTWVAGLALLLYAIDDAHGPAVGWIANRNAIVALAVALPVLLAHDRWRREGWKPGAWLAPLLLAVALQAGESSLAIVGYLAAHALHIDRGTWRARALALLPHAGVVVVWRAVYAAMGYGVSGSGVYLDPGREPIAFVAALPKRLPLLLLGQLGMPWSDFAGIYPAVAPWLLPLMVAIAIVVLALLAYAAWPLLKADPVARFFTTGFLLAALPVCATFPGDRLLPFVGVGAMGLVAMLFTRVTGAVTKVAVGYLVLCHLVLAPLLLPIRSRSMVTIAALIDLADDTIPRDAELTPKTVILMNPPSEIFGAFVPAKRTALGVPRPARFRMLASGTTFVDVTRRDARTLLVRPGRGFLEDETSRLLRGLDQPFHVGDTILLAGMTIRVVETSPDGRPLAIEFQLDVPLEDPSLVWLQWSDTGYAPWRPPAVGATVRLPAHELMQAVMYAIKRAR